MIDVSGLRTDGIIMTRMLGIAITKTSNHLEKHGLLKMSVAVKRAVYGKMMEQDMTCFEEKFKRKDQARVMLNYYLAQKVMSRVSRVVQRVRDISRISSAFFMLRQRSPRRAMNQTSTTPSGTRGSTSRRRPRTGTPAPSHRTRRTWATSTGRRSSPRRTRSTTTPG